MYPETKENPPHRAVIELATQLRMVDIFGHRSAMPQTNTTDNLRAANGQPTGGRNVKYLEGLRGLAALWVVLDHIFRFTLVGTQMTGWQAIVRDTLGWILQGRVCVDLFIVLSGYLLMRPVVSAGTGQLPGGRWDYIKRRARRILPPYYAALLISIGIIALVPALNGTLAPEWADAVPAWGTHMILAHLFLVHNLSYHWASKINPPFWTIATEWQIYFLFPILLLPIWRRMGNIGVIFCALAVGLGGFLILGKGHATAPWYLGLFAMGMAAAATDRPNRKRWRFRTVSLMLIFAILTAECAAGKLRFITTNGIEGLWPYNWAFDTLAGAAAACLLVYTKALTNRPHHWLIRNLSRPSAAWLGAVSYSLYLIHDPLLALAKLGLNQAQFGPYAQYLCMTFIGVPIVLAITWPFHLLFERPYMNSRRPQAICEPVLEALPSRHGQRDLLRLPETVGT